MLVILSTAPGTGTQYVPPSMVISVLNESTALASRSLKYLIVHSGRIRHIALGLTLRTKPCGGPRGRSTGTPEGGQKFREVWPFLKIALFRKKQDLHIVDSELN